MAKDETTDDFHAMIEAKVNDLLERQKRMEALQSRHVEELHGDLEPGEAEDLIVEHRMMVDNMDLLVDTVAGIKILDPFTKRPTGDREGGMDQRLSVIEKRTNGGVKITQKIDPWTKSTKIAATGVAIVAFFSAVPGIWLFLQWVAHLIEG